MIKFFYVKEIGRPTDAISRLAQGERHWRKGSSAYELAHAWIGAAGIPAPVRAVLESCPDYRDAELLEGLVEREVDLRTLGRRSQTDLLALLQTSSGHAVLAVEGKAKEPFGPLVREWRKIPSKKNASSGRERRLSGLCHVLGLAPDAIGDLRYQLFHRAVSAVFEAQRYRCKRALLLVHSFGTQKASFADFTAFTQALGTPVTGMGRISTGKLCDGIELRCGWVADTPCQPSTEQIPKSRSRMRTIKASELETRCLKLIDEIAESGEMLEITKNGRRVARLVPVPVRRRSPFGLHQGQGRVLGDIMGPASDPDWELDADQPELYR